MTKKLLVLVILLSPGISAFPQDVDTSWVRRYDGPSSSFDAAFAMAVDVSGNVYVTGASVGSGTNFDYATIKYYPDGDTAWVRRYDGPGNDFDNALDITVDDSGNVLVTGESRGITTNFDYATIKYHLNGDTAWVRRYNGPGNLSDGGCAVAVDGSGNTYVTGYSGGNGSSYDYVTIKYYPNGDTAWVRRYNGPEDSNDQGDAVAVDDLGNVYVSGVSSIGEEAYDYTTIKYYPNGDTAWIRRHRGPKTSLDAPAIALDRSGYLYVAGTSYDSETFEDYVTIKYHPDGDTAWVRTYNGPGDSSDFGYAVAVDGSGNAYVTGRSMGDTTYYDCATMKYYPNGDTAWVRRYDGVAGYSDYCLGAALDGSGSIYVAGTSYQGGTYFDYVTIRYYPNGDTAWVMTNDGPGNYDDYARAVAVDESGSVYVTGYSFASGTYYDYATMKYVQFLCGDLNKDGVVDVADVMYLINYLFIGGSPPDPLQAGDVNRDGAVDIADVMYLINYLFIGGSPPCEP
jgi:hypothetical protein